MTQLNKTSVCRVPGLRYNSPKKSVQRVPDLRDNISPKTSLYRVPGLCDTIHLKCLCGVWQVYMTQSP